MSLLIRAINSAPSQERVGGCGIRVPDPALLQGWERCGLAGALPSAHPCTSHHRGCSRGSVGTDMALCGCHPRKMPKPSPTSGPPQHCFTCRGLEGSGLRMLLHPTPPQARRSSSQHPRAHPSTLGCCKVLCSAGGIRRSPCSPLTTFPRDARSVHGQPAPQKPAAPQAGSLTARGDSKSTKTATTI